MKILFVIEQYGEEGARYYRDFFRLLRERGASVMALNLCESGGFLEDAGCHLDAYYPLALDGGYHRSIPELRRIIRTEVPSLVQAIETIPAFYAALALLSNHSRRPPLVYGRRHGPTLGAKHKLMDWVAFAASSKVIAVSEAMARTARAEHPLGRRKVTSIFSGVSLEARSSQTADERAILNSLRNDASDHTLLLLARPRKVKGHRVALDAMEKLRKNHSGLRLLFVGEGPDREALQEEVARRGLSDCVFLTGHIEAVKEVLAISDVMIIPSFADAFPKVAVEAFAAGVPVIASRVGGLVDIVRDRETGLLVEPGDGGSLALAVEELLRDESLGQRLAENALRLYSDCLTPEAMVESYYNLYRELVERE